MKYHFLISDSSKKLDKVNRNVFSFSNMCRLGFLILGDFGRIFLGELADSQRKCLIKALENDREKEDYSREIESMTFNSYQLINLDRTFSFFFCCSSFQSYSSCKYFEFNWHLYSTGKCLFIND